MSYDQALANTAAIEKGWYDGSRPADPNPTMNGVIQRTYDAHRDAAGLPRQSVQLMTAEEQSEIYFSYWASAHCSVLGPKTALVVFDHAFNASPKSGIEVLQSALGVAVDGIWGPNTAAASTTVTDAALAERVLWARLQDYYTDAINPRLRPNLESWLGRVLICRKAITDPPLHVA